MPDNIETVIGFDFGKKWIGVAVGQTLTCRASPLDAIRNKDWINIERLLAEWQPQRVIVGLPLNMMGETQQMTHDAKRFSRQIEGRFGVQTELVDERLTSREAWLQAQQGEARISKPEIDSLSAVLITESWLNDHARD